MKITNVRTKPLWLNEKLANHLIKTRIVLWISASGSRLLLLLHSIRLLRLLRIHRLHAGALLHLLLVVLLLSRTHHGIHSAIRHREPPVGGLLLLRVLTPEHAPRSLHGQVLLFGGAASSFQLGPLVRLVVRIHDGLLGDVLQRIIYSEQLNWLGKDKLTLLPSGSMRRMNPSW